MIKIIGVVFHMTPQDGDRESKLYLYILIHTTFQWVRLITLEKDELFSYVFYLNNRLFSYTISCITKSPRRISYYR